MKSGQVGLRYYVRHFFNRYNDDDIYEPFSNKKKNVSTKFVLALITIPVPAGINKIFERSKDGKH